MTERISVLTGHSAAKELGTTPLDQIGLRSDEYAASHDADLAARAARQSIRDLLLDRDTPNGTITVSISGNPRFDANGQFLG